jgi:hypothetical protein
MPMEPAEQDTHAARRLLEHVAIIDGFLGREASGALRDGLVREPLSIPLNAAAAGLVWHLGDRPPLIGDRCDEVVPGAALPHSPFAPLAQALADRIVRFHGRCIRIRRFSMRMHAMLPGASIGVHHDGNDAASGGYVYYLSEDWDPHWGGLLVAFDPGPFERAPAFSLLDVARERPQVAATRFNTAVVPVADRLVVLRNPVRHMVTPVTPAAGDRPRLTIVGYFVGEPVQASS